MRRSIMAAVLATVATATLPGAALASPVTEGRPVAVRPAAVRADVALSHVWQSLNNCGPASVSMILSSMGVRVSQEEARVPLRGTNWLRGMGSAGIDAYVSSQFGLRALARNNGTNDLMKTLITNGFAPMVTQWLDDSSRISHWRVVRGYDDDQGIFFASDPMRGAAVPLSYPWFASNWLPFQYRYAVIYRSEDEDLLRAIVGDDWFDVPSRLRLLARARAESVSIDSYEAWFNYGEAAYQTGRFEESVRAFAAGMAKGPANGIFSVRTSYPAALRLLGREQEARSLSGRLASITPVPLTTPNPDEVRQIQSLIGGQPVVLFRNEFESAAAWLATRTTVEPLLAQ